MTRSRLLTPLLVSTLVFGCVTEEDAAEPHGRIIYGDAGWVEYKPNARFLEDVPGYRSVTIDAVEDREVMTFEFDRVPDVELAPGDVVVGYRLQPTYFRKVVSARAEGHTLEVITEAASLRDAVAEADISAFVPLTDGDAPAPVLFEEVAEDAPPMRPRPGITGAADTTVTTSSALSATAQKDVTITPFTLANRELLQFSTIIGTYKLPLSIKTTSDSYFKLRGGYTVRLVVSGSDIYFRSEQRGGVDLNLGVVVSGSMTESMSIPLFNKTLSSFNLYGISGSLALDVDTTVDAAITVPSVKTGLTVSRDATSYVKYDSAASTKWTKGGSATGAGATYKPFTATGSASGEFRFGIRTTITAKLGGVADVVPLGLKLNSTVSSAFHPELVVQVSPAAYRVDSCNSVRASLTNKLAWFINSIPGVSFDDVTVSSTAYATSWWLSATACQLVTKS